MPRKPNLNGEHKSKIFQDIKEKQKPSKRLAPIELENSSNIPKSPQINCKAGRLPPLAQNKIPDIKPTALTKLASPVLPRTPELPVCATLAEIPKTQTDFKVGKPREREISNVSSYKKADNASKVPSEKSNVSRRLNSEYCKPISQQNKQVVCNRRSPHPTRRETRGKQCPPLTHQIQWQDDTKQDPWQKEREILQRRKKQQINSSVKISVPLKAKTMFTLESTAANMERKRDAKRKIPNTERRSVNLSVQRKEELKADRDWDKDIEEFLEMEKTSNIKNQSTSGCYTQENRGSISKNLPSTKIKRTECSKKGVGFRSKATVEKVRRQEDEKKDNERKERERIDMMIPEKIRKGLKKYGFK